MLIKSYAYKPSFAYIFFCDMIKYVPSFRKTHHTNLWNRNIGCTLED